MTDTDTTNVTAFQQYITDQEGEGKTVTPFTHNGETLAVMVQDPGLDDAIALAVPHGDGEVITFIVAGRIIAVETGLMAPNPTEETK